MARKRIWKQKWGKKFEWNEKCKGMKDCASNKGERKNGEAERKRGRGRHFSPGYTAPVRDIKRGPERERQVPGTEN